MNSLNNFGSFQTTKSCYLDGRYFSIVLKKLCPFSCMKPMLIFFDDKTGLYSIQMKNAIIDGTQLNFIRVIINTTSHIRHSTLLIIDPINKEYHWWNPRTSLIQSKEEEEYIQNIHFNVKNILSEYLYKFYDYKFYDVSCVVPDVRGKNCQNTGYCNAYVLKMALDIISNIINIKNIPKELYMSGSRKDDILRFCNMIEINYKHKLKKDNLDIEYDFNKKGATIGGLGGLVVGTLFAGLGGGLVVGAAAGLLGSMHHSSYSKNINEHSHQELIEIGKF